MMRFFLFIRTWVVNILLAGALVFFGFQTFEVWFANEKLEVNKPVQKSPRPRLQTRVAYRRTPPYRTYEVIARKNLFSSDRREELPQTTPAPLPVMPSKPLDSRFALYGIVIDANEKKALVFNLNKKNTTEKDYVWVKVGDKIGNLNVLEIGPEEVTITEQGSTHVIRLSDQSYSQKRSSVRKVKRKAEIGVIEIKRQKVKTPAAEALNQ